MTHTHSVGLFQTSGLIVTKTSTYTTLTTDRHPCLQRNSNPQSQQASGRRPTLRPRSHREAAILGWNVHDGNPALEQNFDVNVGKGKFRPAQSLKARTWGRGVAVLFR
jgi:hypothetical protein